MMRTVKLFLATVLTSQAAFGAEILVRPSQAGRTSDVFAFSDSVSSYARAGGGFQVRMTLSCYGTNLRMVENPISPYAAVKFEAELLNGNKFEVVFPGWLVMADKLKDTDRPAGLLTALNSVPNAFVARAVKNTLIFDVPAPSGAIFTASGVLQNIEMSTRGLMHLGFSQDQKSNYGTLRALNNFDRKEKAKPWAIERFMASVMAPLKWSPWGPEKTFAGGPAPTDGGDGGAAGPMPNPNSFNLDVNTDAGYGQPYPWLPASAGGAMDPEALKYIGRDGLLTGSYEFTWSSDYKTLNVTASFPGQFGFCGGYFSPLMLFFDQQIPKFNYTSDFKMSSLTNITAWPEPTAKAEFLVLDRNKDGVINDVTEMFGSEDDASNGFEILKAFDENEDGQIDAQDPVFSELKLWRDSTGTGKTQKKDLRTLKQAGVQSISLSYDSSRFAPAGMQAELRQRAPFVFVKNGKKTQGEVIDVWFKGSN